MGTRPNHVTQIVNRHIGQRIRVRRRCLGLTLTQVADILGFSFQQMHKYETGISHVVASTLYDLAQLFGVEISYFFQELSDEQVLPPQNTNTGFLSLAMSFVDLDEEDQAIVVQVARQFAGRRPRPTP